MTSFNPSRRPNIFKIKAKFEGVLFNETFGILGLNRHEMYKSIFKSIRINEEAKEKFEKSQKSSRKLEESEILAQAGKSLLSGGGILTTGKKSSKSFMKTTRNTVFLPKTLKYSGQVKNNNIPDGEGQILDSNDDLILEGIFDGGTPCEYIKVAFTQT
jgi:hypothetical protein